jgi:hypothetical protein
MCSILRRQDLGLRVPNLEGNSGLGVRGLLGPSLQVLANFLSLVLVPDYSRGSACFIWQRPLRSPYQVFPFQPSFQKFSMRAR